MNAYKYYLADDGAGVPIEIYRGLPSYRIFSDSGLERAKKDGSWSGGEEVDWVTDCWFKGEFHPVRDEITEAQAMAFLEQWRIPGAWPGRE